jgi:hypothetical protein
MSLTHFYNTDAITSFMQDNYHAYVDGYQALHSDDLLQDALKELGKPTDTPDSVDFLIALREVEAFHKQQRERH